MHGSLNVQKHQNHMRCHHLHVCLFLHSDYEWKWLLSSLKFSDFKAMWWKEAQFSQNACLLPCYFACVTWAGPVLHASSSHFDVINIICNFYTITGCWEMCYLIILVRTTSDCVTQENSPSYLTSAHSYPILHKIPSPETYPKLANTSWKDAHLLCDCPC